MPRGPVAVVVGDIDLVRALGLAGIPVVLATSRRLTTAALSRYCSRVERIPPAAPDAEAFVDALVGVTRRVGPSVVYTQGDDDTAAVSRLRERFGDDVVVPLGEPQLVAALLDKVAFHAIAEAYDLPVPATRVLDADQPLEAQIAGWDRFPCVLKPATRTRWFGSGLATTQGPSRKSLRFASAEALRDALPAVASHGGGFVLQQSIEGGEQQVCSYHAYVRPGEGVVGEFTGEKVRTWARSHGVSTCVRITDDPELAWTGRDVVARIGLTGVVKLDFKRDIRGGDLGLLEINPRFNLWHHLGARAGVNLPALVWQDAVDPGSARAGRARPGAVWVSLRQDWRAMREHRAAGELGFARWARSVAAADAIHEIAWRDPLPALGVVAGGLARRLRRP